MHTTPPSLFGIERRIAYAHRKYHSGLIWVGVTRGLAGRKFSGSVRALGRKKEMKVNNNINIVNPIESLMVKWRWNGVLRGLD